MLKILLAAIVSTIMLFQTCLAGNKNFFVGAELGPNLVYYKSLPKSVLPQNLNSWVGSLLTAWARCGYRIKGNHLFAEFGGGGSRIVKSENPYNAAQIYLVSLALSSPFFNVKRFGISALGGYQHTYFVAFPTNDHSRKYRYVDSGPTLGIETRFNFKKAKLGGDVFFGFSYEYIYIEHPLRCLSIQVGGSDNSIGDAFIKFRYINQKDSYNLFVLTVGGFWYLWF